MESDLSSVCGVIALVAMAAAVAAKVATMRMLGVLRRRIHGVAQACQELHRQEKAREQERKTIEANVTTLERKKLSLEGKRSRLSRQLADLEGEATARDRQRESRLGALVRD